jgi:predicted  nucleic acid-binding Zn-ribbon protein
MACMEHRCPVCDHTVFNNVYPFSAKCPTCGNTSWDSIFDEPDVGWDDGREPYIREIDDES